VLSIVARCRLSFHLALPPALRAPELSQNVFTSHCNEHAPVLNRPAPLRCFCAIPVPNTNALTDWLTRQVAAKCKRSQFNMWSRYVCAFYIAWKFTWIDLHQQTRRCNKSRLFWEESFKRFWCFWWSKSRSFPFKWVVFNTELELPWLIYTVYGRSFKFLVLTRLVMQVTSKVQELHKRFFNKKIFVNLRCWK